MPLDSHRHIITAAAIDMLDDGKAQLLAYEVPITAHYRDKVLACGPETYSAQVLVQVKEKGSAPITDVTGTPLSIRTVDPDSATEEGLISMASDGQISLTVVDSDIARLNETYFHDLDISTEISLK